MKILRTNIDMTWKRKRSISGEKGGVVWVGDCTRGISDVTFLPDEMFEKIDVNFCWKTKGLLMGKINFPPNEIQQIDPVRVRLSYQDAELTNIDENKIELYEYNERNCSWELLKSRVDKSQKRVVGFINKPGCVALAVPS